MSIGAMPVRRVRRGGLAPLDFARGKQGTDPSRAGARVASRSILLLSERSHKKEAAVAKAMGPSGERANEKTSGLCSRLRRDAKCAKDPSSMKSGPCDSGSESRRRLAANAKGEL